MLKTIMDFRYCLPLCMNVPLMLAVGHDEHNLIDKPTTVTSKYQNTAGSLIRVRQFKSLILFTVNLVCFCIN